MCAQIIILSLPIARGSGKVDGALVSPCTSELLTLAIILAAGRGTRRRGTCAR